MYRNAIYICISWHSKICWFPLKKCWYQQISRVVSCNSYFFIPKEVIAVPSFIISWCLTDYRNGGLFAPPSVSIHERPILNRVKVNFFLLLIFSWILEKNKTQYAITWFYFWKWVGDNERRINYGCPKRTIIVDLI